jgi:YidC/Oxa1 family membrane protein insertase
VLPMVTVCLYLWQQTLFTPPPANEQAEMQQKMMKYMMVFMGFMFYKVASGLCLYFIASTLWGMAERKLLPKSKTATAAGSDIIDVTPTSKSSSGENGTSGNRGKKKQKRN